MTNLLMAGRQLALVIAVTASLTACGGSSKSKSESSSSSSLSSSSVSSNILSSSSSLSSSITSSSLSSSNSSSVSNTSSNNTSSSSTSSSSSSLVAIANRAKVSGAVELKDTEGNSLAIDNPETVSVKVSLLNQDDQVVATSTLPLLESVFELDESLPFAGELEGADARYLVVNVSSPGFTDYARRFDVEEELSLRASLSQLPVETIPQSQVTTISGASVNGFNFSVDGGAPQNSAGQSGVPELSVSIPQSALPSGTSSLDVKMQAFNPNDPEEAEYFPGAYEDSSGNKLLSVAFNFTEVTTNTGASLKSLAQKSRALRQKKSGNNLALAQAADEALEPVIINRKVPSESCPALKQMGDSSSDLAGFQVPVYTYNPDSGLWDLLGQGTLYKGDGTPVASDFTDFDCASTEYVVEIKVTNEIFLSNWWNLDYPLVFNQPVKLCADVQLQDEAGTPITGSYIYVYDDDEARSFSSESFITDAAGNVHVEVYSLDGNTADTSAKLRLFNNNLLTTFYSSLTLSTACTAQQPVVIKTTLPSMCKIEGRVLDEANKPVANTIVFAGNIMNVEEPILPAYGFTDEQGKYQLDVQCDTQYHVFEYFSYLINFSGSPWQSDTNIANVNGNVAGIEQSDNGKTAVLKDMVADRSKPFAYVFNDEENANKLSLQFFYAGKDYPLTYAFTVLDAQTNTVIGQFNGTVTEGDLTDWEAEDFWSIPVGRVLIDNTLPTPSDFAIWSVQGTITDAKGKQGNLVGIIGAGDLE